MFIAIPLLILALAAGVYLLIKVTKEYLGGIFKVLAWLVIGLSLLAIAGVVFRGVHHFHRMHEMKECRMEERMIIKHGEGSCCNMDSTCKMMGCRMEGDSMVMDKEACEKAMGKEACEKMCKERGRCIMSKDECMKMCGHNSSGMKGEANSCPMHKEGKACCMDKEKGEKK